MAEEESQSLQNQLDYLEHNEAIKGRHQKKEGCYSMILAGKDVSEEVRALSNGVEEALNQSKEGVAGGVHQKA